MLTGFLLNRAARQAEPAIGFVRQRCLRTRLNSSTCDRCLVVCKRGALTLSGRKIVFAAEQCTGCMACVSGCPNDAFVSGFDLLTLPSKLATGSREAEAVALTCGKTQRFAKQITIPCLGLLSEPVLAALNTLAAGEVRLDASRCSACDNRHVLDLLEEGLRGLRTKAGQASGLNIRWAGEESVAEADSGQQRRSLLRLVGSSIRDFGREIASPFGPASQSPDEEGEKGAAMISRLLQQTLALLADDAVQKREVLLSYFHAVDANRNCNLCPSCTGMCPTGALKRRTDGSIKRLFFSSALCNGCGLCAAFCRKKALTLRQGAVHAPDALVAIA